MNKLILLGLFQCVSILLIGQSPFEGPETVIVNNNVYYYIDRSNGTWGINGGHATITTQDAGSAVLYIQSAGVFWITHTSDAGYVELFVTSYASIPVPPTPTVVSTQCGQTTLQRIGTPPANIEWYWQTASNGQSISLGNDYQKIVNSSGLTYYLQSKYTVNGSWGGTSAGLSVTVNQIPSPPATNTITTCGSSSGSVAVTLTTTVGAGGSSLKWYTSVTGGTALTTPNQNLSSSTTFYASSLSSVGCESASRTAVNVIIEYPPLPIIQLNSYLVCVGSNIIGSVDGSGTPYYSISSNNGVSWNEEVDATLGNPFSYQTNSVGVWAVKVKMLSAAGCWSEEATYSNIDVQAYPSLTSLLTPAPICSGDTFVYNPTSTISSYFSWNRASISGIQENPSSGTNGINEVLTNTTPSPINVSYTYTITSGAGCITTQNVVVAVKPIPKLSSVLNPAAICSGSMFDYLPTSGTAEPSFTWTRAAVNGINEESSNGVGQVHEVLTNTTSTNINVTYLFVTSATGGCASTNQNVVVVVKPIPVLNSTLTPPSLSTGTYLNYFPTSLTPNATFNWSREQITGIEESATSGTGNINEKLTNNTTGNINVAYSFVTTASNCSSDAQTVSVLVTYQNYDENYIISKTILKEGIYDENSIDALSADHRNQTTQYFDGLGRQIQTVVKEGSPNGYDIVQPITYDQYGRESIKYLPYVTNDKTGWRKSDAIISQNSFYANTPKVAVDTNPFSETIFESSPLNRVLKQGAPGLDWQPDSNHSYASTDHTIKFAYEFNTSNEVLLFDYDAATGLVSAGSSSNPGYYDVGQLYATKTKDEQGNEVIEYTDKQGRVICKNVQYGMDTNGKLYASTYYIYDNFNNLVVVLPPEAVKILTTQN